MDLRERQLRQHIFQQENKAKEALEELQRAKIELHKLSQKKSIQTKENQENISLISWFNYILLIIHLIIHFKVFVWLA